MRSQYLLDRRSPALKLELPVAQSRKRCQDEERTVVILALHEVRDERNGLDRFAETHLVGQNTVQAVVVQRNEPLQAYTQVRKGTRKIKKLYP